MFKYHNILKPINLILFSRNNKSTIKRSVQEVRIPTSAGYIAGKWWGPQNKRPILAIHGFQDNSGSYDRLIPLLSEDIPILAIDLPGHGFSYKLPPGMVYHEINTLILTRQIKNYFGWDAVSLLGHSNGAIMSYFYGLLFPKDIDLMICMDGLQPFIPPKKMDRIILSIDEQIKYDAINNSKKEPPSYTIQEMKQKLYESYQKTIDMETTKYILYRNIAPSEKIPGKFYFNRDVRLKVGRLVCHDPNEILRLTERVTFPLLFTKAYESSYYGNRELFEKSNEILKRINTNYEHYNVYGDHHGHLNEPNYVAPLINNFIRKHGTCDRSKGGLNTEIVVDENIYPIFKFKKKIFEEI